MAKDISKMMEDFRKDYDLDVTIMNVESSLGSFKYLNDFLDETTDFVSERSKYVNTLSTLFNKYIEKKLSPLYYRKSYDLSDVDVVEFINRFEEIRSVRHENNVDGVHPEPFAGLGPKIFDELIERTKKFNKPIVEMWTKRILDNIDDTELLQQTTNAVFDELREAKPPLSNTQERTLEIAVIAHKAMQQVNSKRSFLWRWVPWHWSRAKREENYLKELSEQIDTYTKNGLPVKAIEDKYSTPKIENIHNKLAAARDKAIKADREERERQIEDAKKEMENKKVKALDNLNKVTADPAFKDKFLDDIVKALPKNTMFSDEMKKNTLDMSYKNFFVNTMKICNMNFDEEFSDPKPHLINGAKQVFKNAYSLANMFGCESKEQCLAAAQIITDKVMEKLSPVAVDSKTYGSFANGYALKNAEEFNNALDADKRIDGEKVAEVFAAASKVYADMTRERVFIKDIESNSKEKISEPINSNVKAKESQINKN